MSAVPAGGAVSAVPLRTLTRGPRLHWFGYYDKHQFDPAGRFALTLSGEFEDRQPGPRDRVRLGLIDLADDGRWRDIGTSRSWGWQQGCMLQWRPGAAAEVLWNDREGDRFVTRSLNVETAAQRVWPWPFYTLSPDGHTAVGLDFARLGDMRPECGYAGISDPCRQERAPARSGIYAFTLNAPKVERREVISIAEVVAVPCSLPDFAAGKHYFNHLLFNPDGSRLAFLHRWRLADSRDRGQGPLRTRLFTVALDGSDLQPLDVSGRVSHFIWRDPGSILAWTRRRPHGDAFCMLRDGSRAAEPVGLGRMRVNGHCTYLPGRNVILNDTGPLQGRMQELYLYAPDTDRRLEIGRFHSPAQYTGVRRVDLHPRANRDGRLVSFYSAHAGQGRQMYLADISDLLEKL